MAASPSKIPGKTRIADRYEIKEVLGQGGMGVVYRALDIKTKTDIAMKTMRDTSDPVAVEMFEKEWALLAGLSHPNIVDIRDVGEIEENGQKKPFFVMPLLRGATLATLIEDSSTRLTVERVSAIIMQVCRGLQAAHDHGLIHRDIKPSNIFVMEDDTAKIIDFGVVHLAGTLSVTGHKGTWQYMAPEQVDLKPASPASDLFSLGVVCYEALTGNKPFARSTAPETAEAIRKHIPPPASELNPAVSQMVSRVVHKAMAKEPIHRFVNARDLGETLQKAVLNQPIERFDPARIQPRIERAKKALSDGDEGFALEILNGLETEGYLDLEITLLRGQIEQRTRQRRIRQLLESARTRIEQDEIPLALEKIQEVLSIDPENSDALAMRASIEKLRNERQIESWMDLARKHLDRHAFGDARQALREVLRIRPADTVAGDLLAETDRREQQSLRIRTEREQLYGSAMKAYQNGEMSSALSKLERVLELGSQTPGAAVPERDAAYQSFYNQVRTERDAVQNAYEAVRRHLADKAFARVLEICDEFTNKYPNDALFQALKLEAVEQQRQEQSAYIANVGRRVDAEADLDRKVSILKEACERYPAEQQFQESLKISRERRDLAFSIVAKARQCEERNQFAEAMGQWEILRSLYPRYPGIDIEIGQLSKRREAQAKDESKARLVETIDRALESSDFARARDLAASALTDSPHDAEFATLERRAREGLERSSQAKSLLTSGQQLIQEGRFEEAAEDLRRALACDPKSTLIRDTLVRTLVEQARPLVDADWRKAESLVLAALEIDACHPEARSLRGVVQDAKRKEQVPQCLAEARDLVEAGNTAAAIEKIEAALVQYPNDPRLLQFYATLQGSVREIHKSREREQDVEALRQLRHEAETVNIQDEWHSILERSQSIWAKYPDDPEITVVASEIQQRAGGTIAPTPSQAGPEVKPGTPEPAIHDKPSLLLRVRTALGKASATLPKLRLPALSLPWRSLHPVELFRSPNGPVAVIVTIAALAIVGAVLWRSSHHPQKPLPPLPTKTMRVHLKVSPDDAVVTLKDKTVSGDLDLDPRETYFVKATRLGYLEYQDTRKPENEWTIQLQPAPLHVNLITSEKAGSVFIDNVSKGDLTDGLFQDLQVPTDSTDHTVVVKNSQAEILSLTLSAEPAKQPIVKGLGKDMQAVSSLGGDATLYTNTRGLKANLVGEEPQTIPAEGLRLNLTEENHVIAFDSKDLANLVVPIETFPALHLALHPAPTAVAKIACSVETSQLFIDGRARSAPCRKGVWTTPVKPLGDHIVKIVAPGYEPFEQTEKFDQGENPLINPTLVPLVTTATLDIQSSTPLADVDIDGAKKGQLDSNGSARFADIQPGPHPVRLRKVGFEDFSQDVTFLARQTQTINAKLRPFGTLVFEITPSNARVTYRRNEGESRQPTGSGKVSVPAGHYRVDASADNYEPEQGDFDVQPGVEIPVRLILKARTVATTGRGRVEPERKIFKDLDAFEKCGNRLVPNKGWLELKGSPLPCFVRDGVTHVQLLFNSPGKKTFGLGSNKIHWLVNYVDAANYVDYELDDSAIVRHVVKNGVEDKKSQLHKKHDGQPQYTITVDLHGDKVTVSDARGEIDTQPANHGKIGLKGGVDSFVVEVRQ